MGAAPPATATATAAATASTVSSTDVVDVNFVGARAGRRPHARRGWGARPAAGHT